MLFTISGNLKNEPVLSYSPGSPERRLIEAELDDQSSKVIDIPLIIGGKEIRTGKTGKVVKPTDHNHVLATYHMATEKEVRSPLKQPLMPKMRMDEPCLDGKGCDHDKSRRTYIQKIQIPYKCRNNAWPGEKCLSG